MNTTPATRGRTVHALTARACFVAVLGVLALSDGARAAITYVDATQGVSGNTFATGGSLADTSWMLVDNNTSATQWNKRTDTVVTGTNGGNIFQAAGGTRPELTTQVTGLADGVYDVWVFFWDTDNVAGNTWTIDAGLISGMLTSYCAPGEDAVSGGTSAGVVEVKGSTLSFTSPVANETGTGQATIRLYGVNIGQAAVSGGSALKVFIDQSLVGTDTRTWYDGIGYEYAGPLPAAVPAPAALPAGLAMLAALGVARRRRS